ncbi:MAG TPA: LytTR family DNA-binding domain-containing protein [Catalimonadaceae bacterium]|nr:LytTR family DNA-binding domain-containing protein [Catalimonadaceae bacterium]
MKAVIVEDESLIARELQAKIASVAADVEVVTILPSVKTAKRWFLENAEPDILFMDIQLGDGISFEILEQYDLKCPIVFTTAYDEYAIRAFKVNSVDYLLKPVDEEELARAIEKCRERIRTQSLPSADMQQLVQQMATPGNPKSLFKETFIVTFRNNWIPVKTADIACFYRDNLNYLITFEGEKHILDYNTLEEVEELLDPSVFYRANRQYIIALESINNIRPQENQKLTVFLKPPVSFEIDISREKAPAFKRWLDR